MGSEPRILTALTNVDGGRWEKGTTKVGDMEVREIGMTPRNPSPRAATNGP